MTGLRQRTLLDGNDLFIEFKGALTEQYVCQQLKTIEDFGIYYYTNDRGTCEVDFVVDTGEQGLRLRTLQRRMEPPGLGHGVACRGRSSGGCAALQHERCLLYTSRCV